MIKVTDLRINNWVIAQKIGMCQVNGIQLHSSGETYVFVVADGMEFQHRVKLKDLKGVGLTPEILEKCGFEKGHIYEYEKECKRWRLADFRIENKEGLFYWVKTSDKFGDLDEGIEIKSIHQLQNLYLDLYREELTIALPVEK